MWWRVVTCGDQLFAFLTISRAPLRATVLCAAEPSKSFFGRTWVGKPSVLSGRSGGDAGLALSQALVSAQSLYFRSALSDEMCYGVVEVVVEVGSGTRLRPPPPHPVLSLSHTHIYTHNTIYTPILSHTHMYVYTLATVHSAMLQQWYGMVCYSNGMLCYAIGMVCYAIGMVCCATLRYVCVCRYLSFPSAVA